MTDDQNFTEQVNESYIYPQKPEFAKETSSLGRQMISLLFFIVLYYFLFDQNLVSIAQLVLVIFIHEMGHFLAMKAYNFRDVKMFFVPLVGAYVSGSNDKATQKQTSIMILAGPVPGIILGASILIIELNYPMGLEKLAHVFLFLNLFNLLPLSPLDGGRLLETLFLNSRDLLKKIFTALSLLALTTIAVYLKMYTLLIVVVFMGLRLRNDFQVSGMRKKLNALQLNFYKTYADLTDVEYWKIREVLIKNLPGFESVPRSIYRYDSKEGLIMNQVNNVLDYKCEQDLGVISKLGIVILWILCLIIPIVAVAIYYINTRPL
jgi:Zn-dependent protease